MCYWCGGKGHKNFNGHKFKNDKPRTYNGAQGKNYNQNKKKKKGDKSDGNADKPVCTIYKKKGHPDDIMCIEKTENESKCPKLWTSCLPDIEKKELGLLSIYCQEIGDDVVVINNDF